MKDIVGQLKATGVRVATEEVDDGDFFEFRIRITKSWGGTKKHNRSDHKLA